jgi:glycosyltransferase involved in cell wall biosynthesis
MRILVDALPLRGGGGVTHLENELSALARIDDELRFHTLLSPWSEVAGLPGVVERVHLRSVAHRFAYEQAHLPFRPADVLYCPANFAPLVSRGPLVLTIQNANYYRAGLSQPETKPSRPIWKIKANHWAMRRADAIIAVSQSLADDASFSVQGVAQKLHVVYHGAAEWPAEIRPVEDLPDVYALSVASSAPHKNVEDVVAGWARSRELNDTAVSLVLVGGHPEAQIRRHQEIAGVYSDDLVHLGNIRDRAALRWIYSNALVMILMSTLESFSLAPIEAGSVGCPLILSDIPVHREVVGNNAVFVAPHDVATLAEALAFQAYNGSSGSRPWTWPFSWDDHARDVSALFRSQDVMCLGGRK